MHSLACKSEGSILSVHFHYILLLTSKVPVLRHEPQKTRWNLVYPRTRTCLTVGPNVISGRRRHEGGIQEDREGLHGPALSEFEGGRLGEE